jgi:putative membrane protein
MPAEPAAAPRSLARDRSVVITAEPDAFAPGGAPAPDAMVPVEAAPRSRWGLIFWSAVGGFASLALGVAFWRIIEDMARAHPILGQAGLALLGLAIMAAGAIIAREARAIWRVANVERLRADAAEAIRTDDGPKATVLVRRLIGLLKGDPGTARARAALEADLDGIMDGRGLIELAERRLMADKDAAAKAAIAAASQRVSVVTAISPRALVDILFVSAQGVMLTRRIATIYGGRPGGLGFLRLGRRMLGHLAITGGLAMTDSIVSQLVGHGLAARLSAKLGEGVLNGLLTARVGLAAIAVCRPLPFSALPEPTLTDVAGALLSGDPTRAKTAGPG